MLAGQPTTFHYCLPGSDAAQQQLARAAPGIGSAPCWRGQSIQQCRFVRAIYAAAGVRGTGSAGGGRDPDVGSTSRLGCSAVQPLPAAGCAVQPARLNTMLGCSSLAAAAKAVA